MPIGQATMTEAQFQRISALVKSICGINLHSGKEDLVKARLGKRLRQLEMSDFEQYVDYVEHDESGDELALMLDALSTNVTKFSREPDHFDYLSRRLCQTGVGLTPGGGRKLRIWSAGCASGEEPYSIAICLCESIPDLASWDAKILATDLSTRILAVAREAEYGESCLEDVGPVVRSKYFTCDDTPDRRFTVCDAVRRLVYVARLNLMAPWPMKGPFDAIFCRNVMIYFDRPTQERLVARFWGILAQGGTLFVGHSESLAGIRHGFQYVQPSVYEKA